MKGGPDTEGGANEPIDQALVEAHGRSICCVFVARVNSRLYLASAWLMRPVRPILGSLNWGYACPAVLRSVWPCVRSTPKNWYSSGWTDRVARQYSHV